MFGVLLAAGVKVVINETGVAAGLTRDGKTVQVRCRTMKILQYCNFDCCGRSNPIGNEILYSCK